MYTLTPATAAEIDTYLQIIEDAKNFQKEQGFTQWTNEYPNMETISNDIRSKKGYVLKKDGQIAGYMCIDFDGEPAYQHIQGQWLTTKAYAVIHRMAFSSEFRNLGISTAAFQMIEQLCLSKNITSIRVDTDFGNKRMQHILAKNGYSNCGTVIFQGSSKIAYEKVLNTKLII